MHMEARKENLEENFTLSADPEPNSDFASFDDGSSNLWLLRSGVVIIVCPSLTAAAHILEAISEPSIEGTRNEEAFGRRIYGFTDISTTSGQFDVNFSSRCLRTVKSYFLTVYRRLSEFRQVYVNRFGWIGSFVDLVIIEIQFCVLGRASAPTDLHVQERQSKRQPTPREGQLPQSDRWMRGNGEVPHNLRGGKGWRMKAGKHLDGGAIATRELFKVWNCVCASPDSDYHGKVAGPVVEAPRAKTETGKKSRSVTLMPTRTCASGNCVDTDLRQSSVCGMKVNNDSQGTSRIGSNDVPNEIIFYRCVGHFRAWWEDHMHGPRWYNAPHPSKGRPQQQVSAELAVRPLR
ncbi:hypothetical protein C8R47DRAFT_1083316 [Mycena vitilis]|nr:hypothetical protein C8R47DRAFT_1083316 [Mycena vitilis]